MGVAWGVMDGEGGGQGVNDRCWVIDVTGPAHGRDDVTGPAHAMHFLPWA